MQWVLGVSKTDKYFINSIFELTFCLKTFYWNYAKFTLTSNFSLAAVLANVDLLHLLENTFG